MKVYATQYQSNERKKQEQPRKIKMDPYEKN